MEYTTLEKLDERVSRLGFGCMRFPTTPDGAIDEPRAAAMLKTAYDAGVNYFDTAYFYHNRTAEAFLGRALKMFPRESFKLATKLPMSLIDSLDKAKEIYEETWKWLKQIGCAAKVSPQLLERYAMCSARWIQCEEMTNRMGFLSKHPTTGKPIPSPFINIGINYMNQAVRLWNEIFQIVKETLCRLAPIPRAVILCRTNSSIPLLRHCRRRTSSVNWRISFRRLPGTERSPLLRPRAPLPGWTKKAPSLKAMIPSVR